MENNKLAMVVAIVAIVGLVVAVYSASVTGLVAGGNGRAKGDSCMKSCMAEFGQTGEYFDTQSDLTQYCLTQCNPAQDNAQCDSHADGCCAPFSGDPDCKGVGSGTSGDVTCPGFTAQDIQDAMEEMAAAGILEVSISPGYDAEVCSVAANDEQYTSPEKVHFFISKYYEYSTGILSGSEHNYQEFDSSGRITYDILTQVNDISYEEYQACRAIIDQYCIA